MMSKPNQIRCVQQTLCRLMEEVSMLRRKADLFEDSRSSGECGSGDRRTFHTENIRLFLNDVGCTRKGFGDSVYAVGAPCFTDLVTSRNLGLFSVT